MADFFDTSSVRDDPAYWDDLTARVTAAARAAREAQPGALAWCANARGSWVAASLSLAAALVLMTIMAERSLANGMRAELADAIAPADLVGRALAVRDAPPVIDALLIGPQRTDGR
jgi:hypothetical protein